MVSTKEQNAMAEVIHYLKGIRQEDIEKIPPRIINYLKENASAVYKCDFDYTKPLKDLTLLDETRGIISLICYKYWCITEEQKSKYLKKLNENEKKYQENMKERFSTDNLFNNKNKNVNVQDSNELMVKPKKTVITKIISKIKSFFYSFRKK